VAARAQPIRIISKIPGHINILPVAHIPLYQKLPVKTKQLYSPGVPYEKIAKELNTFECKLLNISNRVG